MTDSSLISRLENAISSLPDRYPGPGGAVAIVKDGKTLIRHTWGYANIERRIPFTPASLFRMCSITKQFTCGVMLDLFPDPSELDRDLDERLPQLDEPSPTMLHLAHNQSGLRDYWAVAMLHGSPIEGAFGDREADHVIRGTRTLQFQPGTSYSYVNQNFRLISDILQDRTERHFSELLQKSIFEPANMERAILAADTRAMPDGTTGYEGTVETGFRAAVNNIIWTGDAGLGASLDDMIAWEKFIDSTHHNPDGLYNRLSAPTYFDNGSPASYGFGLQRAEMFGHKVTLHGGALRGWRSHRLHVASQRLSIVVMFNHMSPAHLAASSLLATALNIPKNDTPPSSISSNLYGAYLEEDTGLSVRIEPDNLNGIRLRYLMLPEVLTSITPNQAESASVTLTRHDEKRLIMERPAENRRSILTECTPFNAKEDRADLEGTYRCNELDEAEITISLTGTTVYGAFSGILGDGQMEPLRPIAQDLWVLPCPRALDHTAPGDWTLSFIRDGSGIKAIRVGCWLARDLIYDRV
ncbi:D-aminopeptidase [Swingsia samuiensis]|uniref:D-aminopeptidase n=1 Tax=Swingsia samuiensis TaxID=1293412 RepID=A0A4Y6UK69_9PROT|nr:D-aminopeptidase [Swingsia samuiensis]QDH16767.1 D-aminopeptidase [Swingsia samuiensis]